MVAAGAKFHNVAPVNGKEFTSADVKASIERYRAGGVQKDVWEPVVSVEMPEPTAAGGGLLRRQLARRGCAGLVQPHGVQRDITPVYAKIPELSFNVRVVDNPTAVQMLNDRAYEDTMNVTWGPPSYSVDQVMTTARILAQLRDSGYAVATREGRRNSYAIAPTLPMRHAAARGLSVGQLLVGLAPDAFRQ